MKNKFVFVGDCNSINLEIVFKSHKKIKSKVNYIIIGNVNEIKNYQKKIKFENIKLNEILDPFNFKLCKKNSLNIFNIDNIYKKKYKNLLNQIKISNELSLRTKYDLVTLPIDKSIFKKEMSFIGMTEYLGKLNNKNTIMIMHGEKFSIIPLTTHINLGNVKKYLNTKYLNTKLFEIINQIKKNIYNLNIKNIKFLCYNPHCSESNSIGIEDKIISDAIMNYKKITGPYSADSAFKDLDENYILFISMYHDQALIPFKILNQKGINLTMGLNYRRLSPAHGTAKNIKFKNIADVSSYQACMEL